MVKKLVCLGMVLALLFSLIGCTADIDGKYKGFSSGFNYTGANKSTMMCAVRSEKTKFAANDVILDFYFGWCQEPPSAPDNASQTIVVLYFGNENANGTSVHNVDDYKNMPDHVFIKEIAFNQFISSDYEINMTKPKGKTFSQNERFTIPKELFAQNVGYLYFWIRVVYIQDGDSKFSTQEGGSASIKYEFANDNTVGLSKY